MTPLERAQQALQQAALGSGEEVEFYTVEREVQACEMTGGRLENRRSSHVLGMAVRVFLGGRVGFAYQADFRPDSAQEALAAARAMLPFSAPAEHRGLPMVTPQFAALDLPAASGEPERMALIHRMAAAALGADPRVKKVFQASVEEVREQFALVNSRGMAVAWHRRQFGAGLAAMAEAGQDSQLGEDFRTWSQWDQITPEALGQSVGQQAAGLLGARPVATARRPLILPPRAAAGFLEAAWEAWSAEAVQRNKSFLAGREGQTVAASGITLVDDGTLAGGLASAPVDDEGVLTRRTVLIDQGKIMGWLQSAETARRHGSGSGGNAMRPGWKHPPAVGPTNFYLVPGSLSAGDLRRQAEGALEISEMLGLHTVDPVSGEFSVGATGWLLKSGERVQPVSGVTVAGTLEGFLRHVKGVANDLTAFGHFASPTLWVDDIMVAGA